MIKYRTGVHGGEPIQPVEILKETPKNVVIESVDPDGKQHQTREPKHGVYRQYHDTWEEAHAFLVARAEKSVADVRTALRKAEGELAKIKQLKRPK